MSRPKEQKRLKNINISDFFDKQNAHWIIAAYPAEESDCVFFEQVIFVCLFFSVSPPEKQREEEYDVENQRCQAGPP